MLLFKVTGEDFSEEVTYIIWDLSDWNKSGLQRYGRKENSKHKVSGTRLIMPHGKKTSVSSAGVQKTSHRRSWKDRQGPAFLGLVGLINTLLTSPLLFLITPS